MENTGVINEIKTRRLSFHMLEIFANCKLQYFEKFLSGNHAFHAFTPLSTMLAGRLEMFALEHDNKELWEEYKRLADLHEFNQDVIDRYNEIVYRASQLKAYFKELEDAGYTIQLSRRFRRFVRYKDIMVDQDGEVDALAFRGNEVIAFEIKNTDNIEYNVDKNFQMQMNNRLMASQGVHVTQSLWLIFNDWDVMHDSLKVYKENPVKQAKYDGYMQYRIDQMLTLPLTAEFYPPHRDDRRCSSCFLKKEGRCPLFQ